MNIYSKKQRWKIILSLAALFIIGASLWYTSFVVGKIQEEEKRRVTLWSEAIKKKADLVNLTNQSFDRLRNEERRHIEVFARATEEMGKDRNDYTFAIDIVSKNNTIPVILVNESEGIVEANNVHLDTAKMRKDILSMHPNVRGDEYQELYISSEKDSLLSYTTQWNKKYDPIEIQYYQNFTQKIYYNDSRLFSQLQHQRDSLIDSFTRDLIGKNTAGVPVIFSSSEKGKIIATNITVPSSIDSTSFFKEKRSAMQVENLPIPIRLNGSLMGHVYYQNSYLLKQLRYYPYIQFGIIGLFLFVTYLIFSTFRKAEQDQVWVGLAKETAHQLGTPLSSLLAWVELLRSMGVDEETITEISKDINRLEIITERFSKIGSYTQLNSQNVYEIVNKVIGYLSRRVSKKVEFSIEPIDADINAQINAPLFEWVIENLTKNAIDAMVGRGKLSIEITQDNRNVFIDISDTGKGIPPSKFKTVFEPGYTTKKRGWGLGLSLVKRIVDNYHGGKIVVKHSEVNTGTTFRISLKK